MRRWWASAMLESAQRLRLPLAVGAGGGARPARPLVPRKHRHLPRDAVRRRLTSSVGDTRRDAAAQPVCPNRRIASQLFYSFGRSNSEGEVGLTPEDLKKLLLSMGIVVCDAKLLRLSTMGRLEGPPTFSENNEAWVREEDFLSGFDWLMRQGQDERDLHSLFDMLDKDGNGYIDLNELLNVHTTGSRISYEEAQQLMSLADGDGDGKLSWSDFLHFMRTNLSLGWKLLTAYRVIFVVGGPASGKGTVLDRVAQMTNSVHVSSGEILRREVARGTPLGLQVAGTIERGELVDDHIILALLQAFLSENPGRYVLLDGFPRSLDSARRFQQIFGPAECYLHFICEDHTMRERILNRGKSSGRSDDTLATANIRIETYRRMSAGPLKYFQTVDLPGYRIDAERSIDDCIQDVLKLPMFNKQSRWRRQ